MLDKLRTLLARADDATGSRATTVQRSGIPADRLHGLEQGSLAGWTTSMVENLARAIHMDPAVLWTDQPAPESPRLHFLRSGWPDFNANDLGVFSEVLERAASLKALRQVLGDLPGERGRFSTSPISGPPYKQGYVLAASVRKQLDLGDRPILDLHRMVAERLDILVAHRSLETARLQAAAIVRPDAEAIVVNDAVEPRPLLHRRSIAHELCHVLFDRRTNGLLAILEGEEDDAPHEQRARAFAAELLVPEGGLIDLIGVPERTSDADLAATWVNRAARHFQAPTELVSNHLVNRGFVKDFLRDATIRATARMRPPCVDAEVDVLAARVQRAADEYRITAGRAAELLGSSR